MTRARSSNPTVSLLTLALAAASGCEIDMKLGELDDTSTSASATDDAMEASSAGSTSAASGNSGVAEDTGGSETGSETDETAGEACLPPPEALTFQVYFDEEPPAEDVWELVVDADCVVAGVADEGDIRFYSFECDEGDDLPVSHQLEVRRSTGPIDLPMAAGTPVHVQVARDYPIDSGGFNYVVVRDAAGELVLGWYGGGIVPEDLGVDVEAWFAPLEYALAFGDCEPVPYEDPGGSFIVDPCPAAETRLAVGFQLGDEGIHLLERTSGQLGPLSLFVPYARHLDPVAECHLPLDAFAFVAFREG